MHILIQDLSQKIRETSNPQEIIKKFINQMVQKNGKTQIQRLKGNEKWINIHIQSIKCPKDKIGSEVFDDLVHLLQKMILATLNISINGNVPPNHIEVNEDYFGSFFCIGHVERFLQLLGRYYCIGKNMAQNLQI